MKLKYILSVVLTTLLFVGCSTEDGTIGNYGVLSQEESYVILSTTGGSASVTLYADADWAIETTLPSWLSVDKLSGTAGDNVLTFSAEATNSGRETELCIKIGNKQQYLKVRQGSLEASKSTCAEINAGPDGKTYLVTGTVTSIANTTYGNWYLNDGTGEVYIYGTLDADGKTKNFSSLNIEVGDVVTVEGPKKTYNGTVELVDVTVNKIVKSLIKVVTPAAEIAKEGGQFSVKIAYKGNGVNMEIPSDVSWVKFMKSEYIAGVKTIYDTATPADTTVYYFNVDANQAEGRSTTITFSSSNASSSSKVSYSVKQEAYVLPHGQNPDDPFTVAEAIAKCQAIGSTSDGVIYYAKGKISSISSVSTSYGNATFNISDDGTDDNAITVYRSYFLNNEKFTAEDQIAVGDQVVITGKLVNYKGNTPEFSGNVYVYSITKAGAKGTLDNPFNIADAIAYIDAGGTESVYVKGVVSELYKGGFSASYGNGSFYISDDGTKYGDSSKDFEAYQVNWVGNRKWTEADPQIAVGDQVIIYGPLTKYKTTYETQGKGAAYIYSLNGKTE